MGISLSYFILWLGLGLSFPARAALSINCILLQIRILHCFTRVKDFGLIIVALLRIASQVLAFLCVWLVLTIGFTGLFYGHFHNMYPSYDTWRETFITLILAALGDFEYDFNGGWWGPIILTTYIVFSGVSLLSCLIAVMTEVFERVQDHEDQEYSLIFAKEVVRLKWNEDSSLGALPAPLNIFSVAMFPLKFLQEMVSCNKGDDLNNDAGRKAELVVFIFGFKVVMFLPITMFIFLGTTIDFVKIHFGNILPSVQIAARCSWACQFPLMTYCGVHSVKDTDALANNNTESDQAPEKCACTEGTKKRALRISLRILYSLFIFPIVFGLMYFHLLVSPVLAFVTAILMSIPQTFWVFTTTFMSYREDFDEFEDGKRANENGQSKDPHWFFTRSSIREVEKRVEAQRLFKEKESKSLVELFGHEKQTFSIDEWVEAKVMSDEGEEKVMTTKVALPPRPKLLKKAGGDCLVPEVVTDWESNDKVKPLIIATKIRKRLEGKNAENPISESEKKGIEKFFIDVYGENHSDLFDTAKDGVFGKIPRAYLLATELEIYLETDHMASIELIEKRIKHISKPFTEDKLDRNRQKKMKAAGKTTGAMHHCCLPPLQPPKNAESAPLSGGGEGESGNGGDMARTTRPRAASAAEVQREDHIWDQELSSTVFRLIYFSISMTPDCNPLRFLNKISLAIKNVKDDYEGFPQAIDKMDSLLEKIQTRLVKGLSLQARMIQSMDESRLQQMLTEGAPTCIEIALDAENKSFLSHPNVERVVHREFIGELFDGLEATGSFFGGKIKSFFQNEDLVASNDIVYRHVSAKDDLRIFDTPVPIAGQDGLVKAKQVKIVHNNHEVFEDVPKQNMVHSYKRIENGEEYVDGAVCLLFKGSGIDGEVEGNKYADGEPLEKDTKVKAQFKGPGDQDFGRKWFDATVLNYNDQDKSYRLLYKKCTARRAADGTVVIDEATTYPIHATETVELASVPVKYMRLQDMSPIVLPETGCKFYELANGTGWVRIEKIEDSDVDDGGDPFIEYKQDEPMRIYSTKDMRTFKSKEAIVQAGTSFLVNAKNVQRDMGGFDWYELADGRGWVANRLPTENQDISRVRRKLREWIPFNALRIPPTLMPRPSWLLEVRGQRLQALIALVSHALQRPGAPSNGKLDGNFVYAVAKRLMISKEQVINVGKWIYSTSVHDHHKNKTNNGGRRCTCAFDLWYMINHTSLVQEWKALSLLAVEPARYLRSPAARYFLEFVFFALLMGFHYAAIDKWNDTLNESTSEFYALEAMLLAFVIGAFLNTYRETVDPLIIRTSGQQLDWPISIMYVVAYSFRFAQLSMAEKSSNRNFCRKAALYVLAANSALLSMRVITILGLSKTIGPMIEAFIKLLKAIAVFILLLAMLILGFGGFFSTWYGNCRNEEETVPRGYCMVTDDEEEPMVTLRGTALILVQATLGDFGISGLNSAGEDDDYVGCYNKRGCRTDLYSLLPKVIGPFMFVVYAMTATVTLLNLLVAVICELYSDEQDTARVSFMVNKVSHCIRLKWRDRVDFDENKERPQEWVKNKWTGLLSSMRSSSSGDGANSVIQNPQNRTEETKVAESAVDDQNTKLQSGEDQPLSGRKVYDPLGLLVLDALPPPLNLMGMLMLSTLRLLRQFNTDISEKYIIAIANQFQFYVFNGCMILLVLVVLEFAAASVILITMLTSVVSVTVIMVCAIFAGGMDPAGFVAPDVTTIWWVIPGVKFEDPHDKKLVYRGQADVWSQCKQSFRGCGAWLLSCGQNTAAAQEGACLKAISDCCYAAAVKWNTYVTRRGNPLVRCCAAWLLMRNCANLISLTEPRTRS